LGAKEGFEGAEVVVGGSEENFLGFGVGLGGKRWVIHFVILRGGTEGVVKRLRAMLWM